MKNFRFKFLTFAVIAISAFLLSSCSEKEPDTLSVSTNRLLFLADDADKKTLTITTNTSWNYSVSGGWVTASKRDDNQLEVTVDKHTNISDKRDATITITAGNADPVTVSIEQAAKKIDNLSVSPSSLFYEADERGKKTATITTDAPSWTATTEASWVSLSQQDKTLTVDVSNTNTSSSERKATIKITAGDAPDITLTVTQGAKTTLSINPKSLSYDADETGTKTVTIETNANSWTSTETASWLSTTEQGNTLRVNVSSENTSTSARSANIKISAGNAPDVTLTVTQAGATPPEPTIYNRAEGHYFGNDLETGTGFFMLDIYHNTDENIGFMIMGFCALTSNPNNFRLATGTYSVASTGSIRTFLPGSRSDDLFIGTYVYNYRTQKFTLVTGGTFTVTTSGSNYTITTNFSGKDYSTGASVSNIQLTYSGTLAAFENLSTPTPTPTPTPSPSTINYSATGTRVAGSGPSSWSGTLDTHTDFYAFVGWGGTTNPGFLDIVNGKLIIDNKTSLGKDEDGDDIHFSAYTVGGTGTITRINNFEVKYNNSTKTLDFSGTQSGQNVRFGYIGVKGNSTTGYYYGTAYTNVKFVLQSTISFSAPQFRSGGDAVKPNSFSDLIIPMKKAVTTKAGIFDLNNKKSPGFEKIPLKQTFSK